MPDVTLALDIAAKTGVCYGVPFERPVCGTWRIQGDCRGARGHDFERKLTLTLERIKPVRIFIEEPLESHVLVRIGSTLEVTIQLQGMVFLAEKIAFQHGIPSQLFSRMSVLDHFVGQPRFKVRDDGKRACEVRCRQLGWPVENWDEADAAALWEKGNSVCNPRAYALAGVNRAVKVSRR